MLLMQDITDILQSMFSVLKAESEAHSLAAQVVTRPARLIATRSVIGDERPEPLGACQGVEARESRSSGIRNLTGPVVSTISGFGLRTNSRAAATDSETKPTGIAVSGIN